MARRRRLRKSDGGDLEVHKQNVASLDQAIAKENVVPTNRLQIVVFSHQEIPKQTVVSSNQPIVKQNVTSSKMKIEN